MSATMDDQKIAIATKDYETSTTKEISDDICRMFLRIDHSGTALAVLDLDDKPEVTELDVRSAYKKLALLVHPDKCQDESLRATYQRMFVKVQVAHDRLLDRISLTSLFTKDDSNDQAKCLVRDLRLEDVKPIVDWVKLHAQNIDHRAALKEAREQALGASREKAEMDRLRQPQVGAWVVKCRSAKDRSEVAKKNAQPIAVSIALAKQRKKEVKKSAKEERLSRRRAKNRGAKLPAAGDVTVTTVVPAEKHTGSPGQEEKYRTEVKDSAKEQMNASLRVAEWDFKHTTDNTPLPPPRKYNIRISAKGDNMLPYQNYKSLLSARPACVSPGWLEHRTDTTMTTELRKEMKLGIGLEEDRAKWQLPTPEEQIAIAEDMARAQLKADLEAMKDDLVALSWREVLELMGRA